MSYCTYFVLKNVLTFILPANEELERVKKKKKSNAELQYLKSLYFEGFGELSFAWHANCV